MITKIGEWVKDHREWFWTGTLLALAAWPAYNLGLLRARSGSEPLQNASLFREGIVPHGDTTLEASTTPAIDKSDPRVVVSAASSTKKYHHVWCAGAKQIKESNQQWFPTATDAEAAGYTLAGNCTP